MLNKIQKYIGAKIEKKDNIKIKQFFYYSTVTATTASPV